MIADFRLKIANLKIGNPEIENRTKRGLPMIEEKNIPELIETSVICVVSAAVAAFGFLLVWLICILAGFGRA
jgi:hypothetical protein